MMQYVALVGNVDVDMPQYIAQVGINGFICCLCDTGEIDKNVLQHHLRGYGHRSHLRQEMMRDPHSGLQQLADGIFVCAPCQTGLMDVHNLSTHLRGSRHKGRHEKDMFLKDLSNQLLSSSFVHKPWKSRVNALLGKCIMNDHKSSYVRAENKINKLLQLERTSLLELAVWRASCLDFDGSGPFETMQDIHDNWIGGKGHEPAAYKSERRFSGSVAVIMQGVLQFL